MPKPIATAIALLLGAACSLCAEGQEVAFLDLTGVVPRTDLRHPPSPPPKCSPNGGCVGGGFGSVGIACGATALGEKRVLRVGLTSLNRLQYSDGEKAEAEFLVENIGEVAMQLPWSPHLADLQPADETAEFKVKHLLLGVSLRWGDHYSSSLGWLSLYGSPDHPGTMLDLLPGESARVRGTIVIQFNHPDGMQMPAPDLSQRAAAVLEMSHVNYKPLPGGVAENIGNDYPRQVDGNELSIGIVLPGNIRFRGGPGQTEAAVHLK